MPPDQKMIDLLQEGEGEFIEFKESLKNIEKESKIHFDRQLYIEETGESLLAVRKIEWFRERSRLNLKLSNDQLLANLNVLKKQNGTFYITQGGVLLFVDEPQQIFPQATVTMVHMESPAKILEQKIIKGTLFEQLESAFLFLKERLRTFMSISSLQREETLEFPEFVIRELLVNAIVHRDYYESSADILIKIFPNSIEFANPGRLAKEIAIKDIYGKSYRRNPLIADLFYRAGYIERAGTGLLRIKEVLQEFQYPPLKIQCEGPFFIVTLFRVKNFDQTRDLNDRQKQIECLPSFFSAQDYSNKFNISDRTARQDLKELVDKKIIKRKKQNKKTLYYK